MRKNSLREFYPEVYPRTLWIATSDNIAYLLNTFDFYSTIDTFKKNDNPSKTFQNLIDDGTIAAVLPVIRKSDSVNGALLVIFNMDLFDTKTIAHEAVHVADYICDEMGITTGRLSENEHYAYLVGWVAGKISEYLIDII